MKKQMLLVAGILLSTMSLHSQNPSREIKGDEVIAAARKVIGVEASKITSFRFKVKTSSLTKLSSGAMLPDSVSEVSVVMPDKIQSVWSREQPAPSKITKTWNGTKYKSFFEIEMFGTRTVRETTNSSLNNENTRVLEGKIDKEKLEALKKARRSDPREILNGEIWTNLFPLLLTHPFEQNLEFKYAGRAESGNRNASIVDVKVKNGKNYRLLFDSETSYLLMMIENYESENIIGEKGNFETKYYFSDRETVSGILIPRKIKAEHKFAPVGKEPRISYSSIEILEFDLNPEFKKGRFDAD